MKELNLNEIESVVGGICECNCKCVYDRGGGCDKSENIGCAESITECMDICKEFYKNDLCSFNCKPINGTVTKN